jgi:hypothetical protein
MARRPQPNACSPPIVVRSSGLGSNRAVDLRGVTILAAVVATTSVVLPASAQDTFTLPYAREPQPAAPEAVTPMELEPPTPTPSLIAVGPRRASWLLFGDIDGSISTVQYRTGASGDGRGGGGTLGLTRYLRAVVDDDQPRSLQAFLQRVSTVEVTLSGGGVSTGFSGRTENSTSLDFGPNASAELYLTRFFLIDASFGYDYSVQHGAGVDDKTNSFNGSLGVGARIGDARIVASYSFFEDDIDGTFAKPSWGSVNLDAFIVIASRVSIAADVFAQGDGGGGGFTVAYYATRNFDVFAGASGQTGGHDIGYVTYNRLGASVGINGWVSPTARFGASYSFNDNHTPNQFAFGQNYGSNQSSHSGSASFAVRLP